MDARSNTLADARSKAFAVLVAGVATALLATLLAVVAPGIAYADNIAEGTWGTCPWELSEDGVLTIRPGDFPISNYVGGWPWAEHGNEITSFVMRAENGRKIVPTPRWSFDYKSLYLGESVVNVDLSGLDVSSITDLAQMFRDAAYIESLNLSGWCTSQVEDMSGMFYSCESLKSLDITGWDTSNVTNMNYMFSGCSKLEELDVSGFSTSNVTDMCVMFSGCENLARLDVSGFDTANTTDMGSMFSGCRLLKELDVSGFDTSKVTDMACMFQGCSALTSINVSSFNTSNVTDMSQMFLGCFALTSVDVSGFNTSKVEDMGRVFHQCSSLESLDLSSWNTSNVISMESMFGECSSLVRLDVAGWKNPCVEDMSELFYGCSSLTNLSLVEFSTPNVKTMAKMFRGCKSLASVDVSSFTTSGVEVMTNMFRNCSQLKELDLSLFDMSSVVEMNSMFASCSSLEFIKLGPAFKFTGTAKLPTITITTDASGIRDYTGRWTNGVVAYSPDDLSANYASEMAGTFTREKPARIDAAEIQLEQEEWVYTGSPIEPKISVMLDGVELLCGIDYTLSYSNNIVVGDNRALVSIIGEGLFTGKASKAFAITPDVVAEPEPRVDLVYNGCIQSGFETKSLRFVSGQDSAKDAGSYVATMCPDFNHTWLDGTRDEKDIKWSIAQASATVKAKDASKVVGEDDPAFEAEVLGLVHGESVSLIRYTLAREEGEGVGTYAIMPIGDESQGNYRITFYSGVFSVVQSTESGKAIAADPRAKSSLIFNGKEQVGVAVGEGFTVAGGAATNAGAYTAIAKLKDSYVWADGTTADKSISWSIAKAGNSLSVLGKTVSLKRAKVKKKAQKVKASKAFKIAGAQGAVSFEKRSGNKKIGVASSGKVTVKKGLKKGSYKVKVIVTATGNANYKEASKAITLKVKVK